MTILNDSFYSLGVFDPEESEYETASRFILDGDIDDDEALAFFANEGQPPWLLNQPDNQGGSEHCVR